ncbi:MULTISPECIES: ribosome recycling factor family protein [Shewanella]|uniref:ribosome recycling factor family protein n=1 Tax=Shewanella TaxID=22 RepID=UPI002D1FC0AA|nr:ribosome recycling factor family protein [Shewanella sp. 10N.7]
MNSFLKAKDVQLVEHVDKLIRLITEPPNITLSVLIQLTQCIEAEARTARFDADTW